jgi:hypothetical protein
MSYAYLTMSQNASDHCCILNGNLKSHSALEIKQHQQYGIALSWRLSAQM